MSQRHGALEILPKDSETSQGDRWKQKDTDAEQYPVTDEQIPPKFYYSAPYIEDHWPHMTGYFPSHHEGNPFVEEAKKSYDVWDFQYTYEWYESPKDKGEFPYSPLWAMAPFAFLIYITGQIKASSEYREQLKIDSNIWRKGAETPKDGFPLRV